MKKYAAAWALFDENEARYLRGLASNLDKYATDSTKRIQKNIDEFNKALANDEGLIKAQEHLKEFFDKIQERSGIAVQEIDDDFAGMNADIIDGAEETAIVLTDEQKKMNQRIEEEAQLHARIMDDIAFESTLEIG